MAFSQYGVTPRLKPTTIPTTASYDSPGLTGGEFRHMDVGKHRGQNCSITLIIWFPIFVHLILIFNLFDHLIHRFRFLFFHFFSVFCSITSLFGFSSWCTLILIFCLFDHLIFLFSFIRFLTISKLGCLRHTPSQQFPKLDRCNIQFPFRSPHFIRMY